MLRAPLWLVALAGCAPLTLGYPQSPYLRDTARSLSRRFLPGRLAPLSGLDSLHRKILPEGSREVRVELQCDLCTPDFLIRIVESPRGKLSGRALLILSAIEEQPDDTVQTRINREYAEWARRYRRRLRCSAQRTLQPVSDVAWELCTIGLRLDWPGILGYLERELLPLAADSGYAPAPWAYTTPRIDSTTGRLLPPGSECNDEAGQGLSVELLDGARYRGGRFWCLEVPGPRGGEHARVAAVRDSLRRLVAGPAEKP